VADRKAFLLRVDPALWAEIEAWAAAELRSANGQVEYLLREAVRRRRGGGSGRTPDQGESPPPIPQDSDDSGD
jgi:hypothetical protein